MSTEDVSMTTVSPSLRMSSAIDNSERRADSSFNGVMSSSGLGIFKNSNNTPSFWDGSFAAKSPTQKIYESSQSRSFCLQGRNNPLSSFPSSGFVLLQFNEQHRQQCQRKSSDGQQQIPKRTSKHQNHRGASRSEHNASRRTTAIVEPLDLTPGTP